MGRRAVAGRVILASLLLAGCSGEVPRTATSAPPATTASTTNPPEEPSVPMTDARARSTAPAPAAITVRLDHYAIEPSTIESNAGTVTLTAANVDGVPHDVTLLRTGLAADQLPTTGIRIDETSPDIEILGRTPRLGPGESGSFTTSLTVGVYLLVCTVPHHYVREAMVATLTVT